MKVTLDEVKIKSRRENHKANEKLHWFSSKISIYFSYFFIRLGLNADSVTILFFILGLIGAFMYSTVSLLFTIIGYIFFRLHIIVDMSDGDLARFYKSFSIRGSYWDSVIHSVVNPLFHISICFSYYMIFQKIEILFFSPFFALSSSVLIAVKNNYFKALFKNKILIETDVNESTKLRNYKIYFLITEFLSIEGLILTTIFVKYYAIFEIAVIQLLIFFIANISASLIKFYNFSYKGKTFKKY